MLNILSLLAFAVILFLSSLNPFKTLYILILFTIFFNPLIHYPYKYYLFLPIGGESGANLLDVMSLAFLIGFILYFLSKRRRAFITKAEILLILLVLLLTIPAITGLKSGHTAISVFRDMKNPFYYFLALPLASCIDSERKLKKAINFILILSYWGLVYFWISKILNISYLSESPGGARLIPLTSGTVKTAYGFYSTFPFFAFGYFWNLSLYIAEHSKKFFLRSFLFFLTIFISLSRGAFVALIISTITFLYFSAKTFSKKIDAKSMKFLSIFTTALISFIFIFQIITLENYTFAEKLLKIPFVERYLSIIKPEITTQEAVASAEFRYKAITYFRYHKEENPNFNELIGYGYGEIPYTPLKIELAEYLGHSAIGWGIFRLGLILFSIYLIILFALLKRVGKFVLQNDEKFHKTLYIANLSWFVFNFIRAFPADTLFSNNTSSTMTLTIMLVFFLSPYKQLTTKKESITS